MGSAKRWGALVAVLAGALGVLAQPAPGHRRAEPIAVAAFGSNGGTETTNLSLPPNSTGQVSTSGLPKNANEASVELDPQGDQAAFNDVVGSVVEAFPAVGKLSKESQQLVTCAFVSAGAAIQYSTLKQTSLQKASSIYLAVLLQCLTMVQSFPSAKTAAASGGMPCAHLFRSELVRVTRTGSGYQLQATGPPSPVSGRPPVIVSCQRKGKGVLIAIRPRRRGQTLRQVLGPKLTIGFANPTSTPAGVHASLKVN